MLYPIIASACLVCCAEAIFCGCNRCQCNLSAHLSMSHLILIIYNNYFLIIIINNIIMELYKGGNKIESTTY